jgi:hypothetical protein
LWDAVFSLPSGHDDSPIAGLMSLLQDWSTTPVSTNPSAVWVQVQESDPHGPEPASFRTWPESQYFGSSHTNFGLVTLKAFLIWTALPLTSPSEWLLLALLSTWRGGHPDQLSSFMARGCVCSKKESGVGSHFFWIRNQQLPSCLGNWKDWSK